MKAIIITLLMLFSINTRAQSCKEFMELVKSENSGTAYTSYTSSSISKVTFYEVSTNSTKLYFAIVCFKREYSINCNEYIYQVASDTKSNYSNNYYLSAGKAFGKYIAPYKNNLKCGPS
ncbi:hypothetical protein ES677_14325 [Bizionia gelidisalsuginis]|uniref:KTSC domain-containing protein n=1 Tax=Bizionia gelidisalsuginis TaxID=291188 RepID=A0ABY3M746_9FLAO|nr:hypothetical protein [Bizionia gelidisalsuginis]TYC08453.1 hypothetical protein ES677_14325 [Bizionia gelidisalsuginis]